MAIVLHKKDYCENCPDFKADVETTSLTLPDGNRIYCHDIYCVNHRKCNILIEHLRQEAK